MTDNTEYLHHARIKEAAKTNDSTIVLYMDLIDSALVQNIRMIEYKAKVGSVENSLAQFSVVTEKYGGYISRDITKNDILSVHTRRILEDTSLILTNYKKYSTVMLRIPHFFIDTVLKEINSNLEHIDYRYSRANDSLITLYTAKNFFNKQLINSNTSDLLSYKDPRLAIQYDRYLENYKKSLGAIILTIYQNPITKEEKIPITKIAMEYKAPFLSQCLLELKNGMQMIVVAWFFILKYWPIFALAILITLILWINSLGRQRPSPSKDWLSGPKS